MENEQLKGKEEMTMNEVSDTKTEKESEKQTKLSSGLDENVAGLLCYLTIPAIIFIMTEKENEFVRFHAIQAIITCVVIIVANLMLAIIPIIGWLISLLLAPLTFILWVFLMYKAYQGHKFKLPVIGNIAEKQLNQIK